MPTPQIVKHTKTIYWLLPTNFLSVSDHFVELAYKELNFANRGKVCATYFTYNIPSKMGFDDYTNNAYDNDDKKIMFIFCYLVTFQGKSTVK